MKINLQNVTLPVSVGLIGQLPKDSFPQIAFSGRSNVGKSSLVNALLGRKKLARVSGSPGKTITLNFYSIDGKMYFVDLPGYGYAKRSDADRKRWSELVDSYLNSDSRIKLIIQLIDMKVGPTDDDLNMLEWMDNAGIPYIIAATKSDKLNKTDRAFAISELSKLSDTVIPFSALSGEGKDLILKEIFKYVD